MEVVIVKFRTDPDFIYIGIVLKDSMKIHKVLWDIVFEYYNKNYKYFYNNTIIIVHEIKIENTT